VRQRKVMAVSSGGGHWVELRRLLPAFEGLEVVYVSTDPPDPDLTGRHYRVRNVTRRNRLAFAVTIRQLHAILRRERPDVVVTTGAAPGLIAVALAKLVCRSRTVWVDTISYSEGISLSGRLARPVADAWLTQWPHLARPGGPEHWGAVL
jgi:UDP-N-acetylglucosamine:LPS N-acetylglucosamine transferase